MGLAGRDRDAEIAGRRMDGRAAGGRRVSAIPRAWQAAGSTSAAGSRPAPTASNSAWVSARCSAAAASATGHKRHAASSRGTIGCAP